MGIDRLVLRQNLPKNKKILVVLLGATGTGKSRLSVDLATHFSPCEIINSDKIQLYRGLPILTNKMPVEERRGVPHHLIDEYDSVDGELTAGDFRLLAASRVSDIWSRKSLPILVGGSNSYIHAFLTKHFDSNSEGLDFESVVSAEIRYDCCFLWLYVSPSVHKEYINLGVQQMLDAGMLEELSKFFEMEMETPPIGVKKSIGVPEFERYFKVFPPVNTDGKSSVKNGFTDTNGDTISNSRHLEPYDAAIRKILLEEAIQNMKENAYKLAKKQVEKIEALRSCGWNILKLDATEVIQTRLTAEPDSAKSSKLIWEKKIVEPSIKIIKQFLEE
ncbi:hypothetical protein MKW94_027207 [Papaver nudicaule]|uniref:Uncharacterized protein n=1 Tax=Papaver nudicaule TaxID=74823 RepID=A0AA41VZ93_PAPNU|nr:hypothetical protein [Papaver nudicaule]